MNALTLINTENLSRDEWLAARRLGIGGSDIAKIAGVAKHGGAMSVALDKLGKSAADNYDENEAAEWGSLTEPLVRARFAQQTGFEVREVKAILQHPKHPWMLANLDGLIVSPEEGILEIKNHNQSRAGEWCEDEGRVPDDVRVQVLWYMEVCGLRDGWGTALLGGQRQVKVRIPYDRELAEYLVQIGHDFWECIKRGELPAIDGTDDCTQVLSMLYSASTPGQIILPDEALRWFEEYDRARADIAAAEERKVHAGNALRGLLGPMESGLCGGRKVTWKPSTVGRLDTDRLKREQPEIYRAYVQESVQRRLLVK